MKQELLRLLLEPLKDNAPAVFFALALMALDIVMGITNAGVHSELSSAKMREGLTKKIGSIYAMVAASMVDSMLLGGLDLGIVEAPVLMATCVYLCVMEVLSLVETIKRLNPDLADLPLFKAVRDKKGDE